MALQRVLRGYWGSQKVTKGFKGLQRVTGCDKRIQGVTGGYIGLHGVKRVTGVGYRWLLEVTRSSKRLQVIKHG